MALIRVRIANTEAIAQYVIPMGNNGIFIKRIVTTNYNGKGRRKLNFDPSVHLDLIKYIAEEISYVR